MVEMLAALKAMHMVEKMVEKKAMC